MNQWHHCVLEMCTTVCPWFFHYSHLIVTETHASAFRKCSSQRLKVFEETLRVKLTLPASVQWYSNSCEWDVLSSVSGTFLSMLRIPDSI